MKVKKNNIQTWPPDTEVMESDNTYVSAPALTFLTNQLLNQPLTIEDQQRDANLAALGIDGSSLRNQTLRDAIKEENFLAQEEEQKIQRLMSTGHTRDSAIEFLRESQTYGRIESVAPFAEFLSPAGDLMGLGEAVKAAIEGRYGEAGVVGGLSAASLLIPGKLTPDGRKMNETVSVDTFGGKSQFSYDINRETPSDNTALTRLQTEKSSPFYAKMRSVGQDGDVYHDFTVQAHPDKIRLSGPFQDRVDDLIEGGLSRGEAESKAMTEIMSSVDQTMRKMYSEVNLGEIVDTRNYSSDSYPLFLTGLRMGKYQALHNEGPGEIMNKMGKNLSLFKNMRVDDWMDDAGYMFDEFRSNPAVVQEVKRLTEKRMSGVADTPALRAKAEKNAEKELLLEMAYKRVFPEDYGLDDEFAELVGESFEKFLRDEVGKVNQQSLESLARVKSKDEGISIEEAKDLLMDGKLGGFRELRLPQYIDGDFYLDTPPARKIRMEDGGYVSSFKAVKKKAKYGMRVKK